MQRSSESIAALAAALAKAQAEMVNPEKSMTGTIGGGNGGDADRSFRYASLSSGLDIVRKTLGQHEIATVQTTAIDQPAGLVNLTTVLAHASGEWIASDWPVCAVAETANPQRMGAALTYARRYSLFTLVGIAGEDDLDAPDLAAPTTQTAKPDAPTKTDSSRLNGSHNNYRARQQGPRAALRHEGSIRPNAAGLALAPEASAQLRDRLVAEIDSLESADDAALWAHRCLPEKNRLTAADARRAEAAFAAKLAGFQTSQVEAHDAPAKSGQAAKKSVARRSGKPVGRKIIDRAIDKRALRFPEPRRVRDPGHVKYVAQQPCLICGRQPSDAHHLRFAQSRALGRKVSDEFTVPLCRGHHRELHRHGDEAAWWRRFSIDPTKTALKLWRQTRGTGEDSHIEGPEKSAPREERVDAGGTRVE